MPRDIPVGNGRMLVTFDQHYQIRDLYFPHVGQENHAGGGPCRFGIYADVPGRHRSGLRPSDPEPTLNLRTAGAATEGLLPPWPREVGSRGR